MAANTSLMNRRRDRRQEILNWLSENPGATTRQIAEANSWELRTTTDYLKIMRDDGEIASVEQRNGKYAVMHHTAVLKRTALEPQARANAAGKTPRRPPTRGPWHYIHKQDRDNDRPIPNQGGQGAINAPRSGTLLETCV